VSFPLDGLDALPVSRHLLAPFTPMTTGVFAGALLTVPSQVTTHWTRAFFETRTATILGLVTPPVAAAKVRLLSVPDANVLQNAPLVTLTAAAPVANDPASAPTTSSSHGCRLIREPPSRSCV
jgi:hypothetical protein